MSILYRTLWVVPFWVFRNSLNLAFYFKCLWANEMKIGLIYSLFLVFIVTPMKILATLDKYFLYFPIPSQLKSVFFLLMVCITWAEWGRIWGSTRNIYLNFGNKTLNLGNDAKPENIWKVLEIIWYDVNMNVISREHQKWNRKQCHLYLNRYNRNLCKVTEIPRHLSLLNFSSILTMPTFPTLYPVAYSYKWIWHVVNGTLFCQASMVWHLT